MAECETACLTTAAGSELPEGTSTSKGVDRVHVCVSALLELKPEEYCLPKAKNKGTVLDEFSGLLDLTRNPSAYRLCQDAAIAHSGVTPLFGLAQNAPSDVIRAKALEVLARITFGNECSVAAVGPHDQFLPTVRNTLQNGQLSERIAALQLVQAVVASPCDEAKSTVPELLREVAPKLTAQPFHVISHSVIDVLVSCSFHCPRAVAEAVTWPLLTAMVSESSERPKWLPAEPLFVLVCGVLVLNCLREELESEPATTASNAAALCLADGGFLAHLPLAMEAAVQRREWPQDTGAFHSPGHLAECAHKLAELGYRRQLRGTVEPLAKAVETSPETRTHHAALRALRSICMDPVCLEVLLTMETFRGETLEHLHRSGDEPEATDLLSFCTSVENYLNAAHETFDVSKPHCAYAPNVSELAEIFARFVPLDCEMDMDLLAKSLRDVPVGPSAAVFASLSGGGKAQKLNFQQFAEHIYGTPTLLGWWPSLMERAAAERYSLGDVALLPGLVGLLALFESSAGGDTKIGKDTLLQITLPTAGLPVEGVVVEDAFAELRFDEALEFPAFAGWVSKIYVGLAAAAAQEAEA